MIHLILGGARSGKSAYAEKKATDWSTALDNGAGRKVIYVATAEALDEEMSSRITHHQIRRPTEWGLLEAPLKLPDALKASSQPNTLLLVDCLTLWLSNLLCAEERASNTASDQNEGLLGAQQALLDVLPTLPGPVILVSNEVGWGVVPMGALNRVFVDEQGRLNQRVAAKADQVTLIVAGLPIQLKGP